MKKITLSAEGTIIPGFFFALLLFSTPIAQAQEAATEAAKTAKEVDLLWGVKIPLRDGIKLNANVYKPKTMAAPLPVILTMTPYTADNNHTPASYFARNGYVFVVVDVRGRGNSEGTLSFRPMSSSRVWTCPF